MAQQPNQDDSKPVLPCPEQYVSYDNYGEARPGHQHAGEDFSCPTGTPMTACEDGTVTQRSDPTGYGTYIDLNVGKYVLRYAHLQSVTKTGSVKRGQVIGISDCTGGACLGPHLHFEVRTDGGGFGFTGTIAPQDYLTGAVEPGGGDPGGGGGGVTPGGGTGVGYTEEDLFAVGRAAAFSSTFELPGVLDGASQLFSDDKSLFNDQPLLPFIEQLCSGSFRQFQSLPGGEFFAFFPDYFGAYGHRSPYWQIDDVEIIDGQIKLTDSELATHVFVAGDTIASPATMGQVDFPEMVNSKGVITIFDAFNSRTIVDRGEEVEVEKEKEKGKREVQFARLNARIDAIDFLKRYGVRPYFETPTWIRNPYFEVFYAFITFQLMWAKQFLTTFTLTFMPELYPGGIVAFEKYGFQAYIESVEHTFDYEEGFTTQANLMAPAALDENDSRYSRGMVKVVTNAK